MHASTQLLSVGDQAAICRTARMLEIKLCNCRLDQERSHKGLSRAVRLTIFCAPQIYCVFIKHTIKTEKVFPP